VAANGAAQAEEGRDAADGSKKGEVRCCAVWLSGGGSRGLPCGRAGCVRRRLCCLERCAAPQLCPSAPHKHTLHSLARTRTRTHTHTHTHTHTARATPSTTHTHTRTHTCATEQGHLWRPAGPRALRRPVWHPGEAQG
jgi:hypothetical protein